MENMEELVNLINKHNYNYYVLDNPTISDADYDKLYDRLIEMEKETGIILPNSPTQRVGDEVLAGFVKRKHEVRLFSLNKVRNMQDLASWVLDIKKEVSEPEFAIEYKFDGLTIVCEYNNGKYLRATTRGNGVIGEDVTLQVKTIKTVPLFIPFKGRLIVQGEGMMTLTSLSKFNKKYPDEKLKNARNAVAGAIRNLDPKETAKRDLDFFAYSILLAEGKDFKSQKEMHDFLVEQNFNTGDYFKVVTTLDDIEAEITHIDNIKSSLDIMTDGVVIKLNTIKEREDIGYTSKFPKWAMAYKFEALEVSATLLNVIWQVGRTGKVTPIALIEPVELAGATVSRATLNNYDDIKRKKVEIGSTVFVRRSNEVIPEILGLAEKNEISKEIIPPKTCPSCGYELVEKGPLLFCINHSGCKEQVIDRLAHFASKEAFDIVGFSDKTAETFYNELNVRKNSDIFKIKRDDIFKLDKFKDKKTDNLLKSIEKSKKIDLNKFIYALGIPEVGTKTAKDLAKRFGSLDALLCASYDEIASIYDIGIVIAEKIVNFFKDDQVLTEINELKNVGVKINSYSNESTQGVLSGKTIVLTGSLESLTRNQATELIEKNGGQVISSVSKNTGMVIVGKDPGSKFVKAKNLGIKMLNEQEFLDLLRINV